MCQNLKQALKQDNALFTQNAPGKVQSYEVSQISIVLSSIVVFVLFGKE